MRFIPASAGQYLNDYRHGACCRLSVLVPRPAPHLSCLDRAGPGPSLEECCALGRSFLPPAVGPIAGCRSASLAGSSACPTLTLTCRFGVGDSSSCTCPWTLTVPCGTCSSRMWVSGRGPSGHYRSARSGGSGTRRDPAHGRSSCRAVQPGCACRRGSLVDSPVLPWHRRYHACSAHAHGSGIPDR